NRINFFLPCVLCGFYIVEISSTKIACAYNNEYLHYVTKELKTTIKDTCSEDATACCGEQGEVGTMANNFVRGLTTLKKMTINIANLKTIEPEAFKNLSNLTSIDLDVNKLKVVEAGIFNNIPRLHDINLKRNVISSIEIGAFKNLPKLVTLELS